MARTGVRGGAAVAAPMPEEAPVTSAILLSMVLLSMISFLDPALPDARLASAPLEARCAPLYEGLNAFLEVFGGEDRLLY